MYNEILRSYYWVDSKVLNLFEHLGVRVGWPNYAAAFMGVMGSYNDTTDSLWALDFAPGKGLRPFGNESVNDILLHELIHWTGAPHRLKRQGITPVYFSDNQVRNNEEWTAVCGSALLMHELGLPVDHLPPMMAAIGRYLEDRHGAPIDRQQAEQDAYRAVGYLKYCAPHILCPSPRPGIVGPYPAILREAA